MPLADRFFRDANYLEAGLWLAVAMIFAFRAILRQGNRKDCAIAAMAFVVFGVSDIIETRTGAWWRPWWLLAMKGACLAVFLVLLIRYVRARRKSARS